MNKRLIYLVFFFISTLVSDLYAQKSKDGWQYLFNGKDLSGWKQLNGKAKYEVKDGAIVGTSVADTPNSFLTTEKDYGDFIFECDVMVDNKLNSGIQFRSLSIPEYKEGRVHGYQMEIDPSDRAWSGGIYDESRRGWLYSGDLNPAGGRAFKKGQWNKYRVEAIGSHIRTFVNDVPVAYIIDDLTLKGFICLQVHGIGKNKDREGTQVKWKNVRIKTTDLKPSAPSDIRIENFLVNDLDADEKREGWVSLFDGKSADHWRGYNSQEFPPKRWSVKDETITVSKSDGSETGNDIVSKQKYGPSFEFQFDFKLTEGANSGVKYFVNEGLNSEGKSGLGLEYQILDDEKHPDAKMGVVGNRTLASLYDLIPAEKPSNAIHKIGEWNKGRIVVHADGTVQHFLNSQKVVEYKRGGAIYKALVARSKYAKHENFGLSKEGNLLLQDHGDQVFYRNLKVKTN
ncbi:hypothetical protein DYBT9275_02198 [Dyadobacter sp. CECT 9275]|uniref:3-keto-alpha-glucoside-1,2-lyase/3-keto-2-hydroxy-glucal hydratase domain-containing protein n=1 Tax=Dyadobacter helix TaxID=2822344 RepID=A0A916JDM9_9BACT|nr:DUF1080 domain-containing protein [Dyadobacter sp. CECT 9275]CAG4999305.1 hypothetical protein DYBT9275_02198 [Dyadobacter sp. CECT 9275]